MNPFSLLVTLVLAFLLIRDCSGGGDTPKILSENWYIADYDATDDSKNHLRSGMRPYIDYGTGCQYVSQSPFAALTPRLDKTGKQVCDVSKKVAP
jgi:hypothetical protein